jgi:prephenate dehydratase
LLRTLKVFADRNINLVKLESRPIAGRPWEYAFYVDLEGSLEDPTIAAAIEEVRHVTDFLKILGSYPASP